MIFYLWKKKNYASFSRALSVPLARPLPLSCSREPSNQIHSPSLKIHTNKKKALMCSFILPLSRRLTHLPSTGGFSGDNDDFYGEKDRSGSGGIQIPSAPSLFHWLTLGNPLAIYLYLPQSHSSSREFSRTPIPALRLPLSRRLTLLLAIALLDFSYQMLVMTYELPVLMLLLVICDYAF